MFSRRTFGKAAMHDNGRWTADRLSLELTGALPGGLPSVVCRSPLCGR